MMSTALTLTTAEMQAMLEEGAPFTLINVLGRDSFDERRIPGSINIPVGLTDFVDRVERAAGAKTSTIVVYCANLQCQASPTAAQKLRSAGFVNVYDYEEGMEGWEEAGMPVERGRTGGQ